MNQPILAAAAATHPAPSSDIPIGPLAARLANDNLEALRARWVTLDGNQPASGLRRDVLAQAILWREQAAVHGDIDPVLHQALVARAHRLAVDRKAAAVPAPPAPTPRPTGLDVGSRLIRVWRGDTYVVDVIADGLSWNGTLYGSLSEIARLITGTRWNGLLFFGLRKRPLAASAPARMVARRG